MRKFPSIQQITETASKTFLRFPLEIIIAFFGTFCANYLFDNQNETSEKTFIKLLLLSSLLLVGQLSFTLYTESKKTKTYIKWLGSAIIITLLSAFIFNFSNPITDAEAFSFIAFNLSLHLLVSFAGFLPLQYNQYHFWEFNKHLFIRILTSVLYSGVLYLGLAIAITAVKNLFEVDINDKIYFRLFSVIAGIFNTVFFLSGVLKIEEATSTTPEYPKELKTFTQYVLVPLISIYAIILLCYEGKIIAKMSLPIGWVSYLVLAFGLLGILSYLLIFPIADKEENLWMKTFKKWFYIILIPLLGLQFWAIIYRISNYGFTHERYYVLLLAIWLTFVAVYFLLSKKDKIIIIPMSMCLFGLFSIIGPQSAYSISKNSQFSRFESYLAKIKTKKLNATEEQQLSSITEYLDRNYGNTVFKKAENYKINQLLAKNKNVSAHDIMNALGQKFRYFNEFDPTQNTFFSYNYQPLHQEFETLTGFDFSFKHDSFSFINCKDCFEKNGVKYSISSNSETGNLILKINSDEINIPNENFITKNSELTSNLTSNNEIFQLFENEKYLIKVTYLSISGKKENQKPKIESLSLKIKVKIK